MGSILDTNFDPREFITICCTLTGFICLFYLDGRFIVSSLKARIKKQTRKLKSADTALAVVNFAVAACTLYGAYVEPMWYEVTTTHHPIPEIHYSQGLSQNAINILHLTDLHLEPPFERGEKVLSLLGKTTFDLVVLTGDYLNSESSRDYFKQFLRTVARMGPAYAIAGNFVYFHDSRPEFENTGVTLLENSSLQLEIKGIPIEIMGVSWGDIADFKRLAAGRDPGRYSILLYHSPDLMPEAVQAGIDLYLSGHTHGGQVRLPWYGALVTLSKYGKKYEAGLYREGKTRLYVARGTGLEGWFAPRVRFLCRPEIAVHRLGGSDCHFQVD